LILASLLGMTTGYGFCSLPKCKNNVEAILAEVTNCRADLVTYLVQTVNVHSPI
jgi:hypothetical protein